MKLRYTLPALTDLQSILEYVGAHSPQGAERISHRIQTVIDLLLAFPDVGVRTDDATVRRLPTSPYPYVVFYEVSESEIIIHAVRHAARDALERPPFT